MKYLLAGLLLIAGALGHGTAVPPIPVQTFAAAQFRTANADVATVVEIDVSTFPGPVRVGLSIERTRQVCDVGACQDVPVIYGETDQNVFPGDALVAAALDTASVHATIFFHDPITHSTFPVRVDAVWSATGPMQCGDRADETGCDRPAVVTATVTSGARSVIAGQSTADGLLRWRGRDW